MQSIWKCGLEHCKVAKDIDIALLRSCRKDWWITMENVQISQELFFLLVRYFLIGQEETEPEITKALEKKMDALVMRELYTQYKTAPTEEEKEKLSDWHKEEMRNELAYLECYGVTYDADSDTLYYQGKTVRC